MYNSQVWYKKGYYAPSNSSSSLGLDALSSGFTKTSTHIYHILGLSSEGAKDCANDGIAIGNCQTESESHDNSGGRDLLSSCGF
jgi:hypothetical protein